MVSRNASNQIIRQVRYTYDPYDRLRTKELDASGDLTFESVEHYASDGADRVLTVDGAWATVKSRHLYGPDPDQPLATQETAAGGGSVHWTLPDRVGSVRDAVTDLGSMTHVEYGGFGEVLSGTPQYFGFAGAAYDAHTQLYHHDAGWGDPNTNLFLGEDPTKDGSNWFLYARNNPVSFTDPSGLAARLLGRLGNAVGAGLSVLSPVVGGAVSTFSTLSESAPLAWSIWDALPPASQTYASVDTTFHAGVDYSFNHAYTAQLETQRLAGHYQHANPGLASDYLTRNQRWTDYLAQQSARRAAAATAQLTNYDPQITAARGAQTGLKANVNAVADTVISTVSLGQYQTGPLWAVTDADLSNGYGASYMFARGGYELLAGVGTAGMANVKAGGTAVRLAGQTARVYDVAGNAVNVYEGYDNIVNGDGLTWSSGAQLVGGLAGLRGNFADYAIKVDPTKLGINGGNIWVVKTVQSYEVGSYSDLTRRSVVGDNLSIHHVGQGHAMAQVVPGYDYKLAPTIAVPRDMHIDIPTLKGAYTGTARSLVAQDIRSLRNYTDAPNASLKQLIQMNKQLYPGSFQAPVRTPNRTGH